MRQQLRATKRPTHLRPLALAAAMLMASHVQAQVPAPSFTQGGANSTTGIPSGLPFVGNPASLNFGTDTVYIANGAPGSFSALAGAVLQAGALSVANSGTGVGTFTATGINAGTGVRTQVLLGGNGNRLEVGNWGTGTLTVSAGALLDATVNSAACSAPGANCFNFIGNGAGSTATLNITGAGSEVRTLRGIAIGHSSVFTSPPNNFQFGTPGGTTNAFVNVLNGGTLRTELGTVAQNNASPNGLGTEKANGTVTVDGAGSKWVVTRSPIDNSVAALTIGRFAGADGLVTISGGGLLQIDGTGSPGPNDGINIGNSGGKGALIASGIGSTVQVAGNNGFINVGGNSLGPANGSFQLLAGATASTLYVNVGGSNGGNGTMTIDGIGSTLTQSGVGTNQSPGNNGPAFAHIGRNNGGGASTGTATISNGGQWLIGDGGGDGRTAQGSPGIALGRGANSTGSLTITGIGSKVEIVSTSMNPGAGLGDNYNPFLTVGYDNAATSSGSLTVSAGGKLIMTGNALSTVANPRSTQLNVGGRIGTAAAGTATVTGAGSEIIVQGNGALINVGREAGANGTLNVLAGGKVSSTSLVVGISGSGTVNIDNATIALSGTRTDTNPLVGAGMSIGRGVGGSGALNMSNGARLTVDPTVNTGGVAVGGDSFLNGGTGIVTMSGGSSIVFGGPLSGNNFSAGRTGTGTVNLSGASFIDVGNTGTADFGRSTGGVGNLSLAGGSKLKGGDINFGGNTDILNAGGTATVTVAGAGSEIVASGDLGRVLVGRSGSASLSVTNQGSITAKNLTVGRAGTGVFTADNAVINLSGEQSGGFGAALSVGNRGGNGTASINNSTVTIANNTAAGASLNVGGTQPNPLGTGVLNLTGGTNVQINANPGLGRFNIGYDGSGTVNMSGAGTNVSVNNDGEVYVARQVGSNGMLVMGSGTTLSAGFVGVGVSAPGVGNALGPKGGTGKLVLNNSIINTKRFELGEGSMLTGDNGTISAGVDGPVIIGGIVSPGNSPGRLRIKCDVTMLATSKLILEINDKDGGPGVDFDIDELIIGDDSKFDLTSLQIIFSFVGSTNPNEFAASEGGFNLDRFLLASGPDDEILGGLSTLFGNKRNPDTLNWGQAVNSQLFAFESTVYDVSETAFNPDTGRIEVTATAKIPEPASMALVLLALAAMAITRRRKAQAAQAWS